MIKNIFQKSFEQNQHPTLPPKASRILREVAKEFIRPTYGPAIQSKQLELAYAILHMRIYQKFGMKTAAELMPIADRMLSDLAEPPVMKNSVEVPYVPIGGVARARFVG